MRSEFNNRFLHVSWLLILVLAAPSFAGLKGSSEKFGLTKGPAAHTNQDGPVSHTNQDHVLPGSDPILVDDLSWRSGLLVPDDVVSELSSPLDSVGRAMREIPIIEPAFAVTSIDRFLPTPPVSFGAASGAGLDPPPPAGAIPAPGTLALLGLGAWGLPGLRRRRRASITSTPSRMPGAARSDRGRRRPRPR